MKASMTGRQIIGGAAALVLAGSLAATPALADGEFFKADTSRDSLDMVGAIGRGPLTFTGSFSQFDGGSAVKVATTYGFPVADVATVRVGPSFGKSFGDDASDWQLGARLVAESYQPTSFGSVFLLGEFDTIDTAWFLSAQVNHLSGWGAELTAGGSDNYDARTLAVTKRVADGPYGLRAGYRWPDDEIFLGVSLNTF